LLDAGIDVEVRGDEGGLAVRVGMEDPKGEDGALSIGADEEIGDGFLEVIHDFFGGEMGKR
jgi:hypothetical protein